MESITGAGAGASGVCEWAEQAAAAAAAAGEGEEGHDEFHADVSVRALDMDVGG